MEAVLASHRAGGALSPRSRRLLSDLSGMQELADESIEFRAEGSPPEVYHLMFSVPGLELTGGRLQTRHLHRCDVYLHLDYPRRPPVITWLTPIFHPNILGPERNGGVCLGRWSAAESLADLSRRLCDLIAYRSANPADALNTQAAEWMRANDVAPGADVQELAQLTIEDAVAVSLVRS
jgi:ubiquitin-protein ligase